MGGNLEQPSKGEAEINLNARMLAMRLVCVFWAFDIFLDSAKPTDEDAQSWKIYRDFPLPCLLRLLHLKALSDIRYQRLIGRVKRGQLYRFANETLLPEMHSREEVPSTHL